jgi:protein-glutamine gamma-glutamyltransferase
LRHLGYSTRVVSGFYAAPKNFDCRSQHTPVFAQDVHFWAEVELGGGRWATVESTPGYEVLEPPATIGQRCLAAMRIVWRWCWNNMMSLTIVCIVLAGGIRFRRCILNMLATCLWRIAATRSAEACIFATARLLDCRCRWAGQARPAFITPTRWFDKHYPEGQDAESLRRTFLPMVNFYLYAPVSVKRGQSAWTQQEVYNTCLCAVRIWSLRECCVLVRHDMELKQSRNHVEQNCHTQSAGGRLNVISC